MHEKRKQWACFRRGAAAFCAALLLCTGSAMAARAEKPAGTTAGRMLIPAGHTVGIKMYARGVMVVGLPEGVTPARQCGLEKGDVILRCGGTNITSTEQFQSMLQSSGGESLELQIQRNCDSRTLSVVPQENEDGAYAIGAWIRDSMAGIGTVTYYDPATKTFGALGHGITDVDTAVLMPFSAGSVLPSTVKAVKRGEAGSAGELRGDFVLDEELGTLDANTAAGIFGRMEAEDAAWLRGQALPVAKKGEVKPGRAVIRSNVQGDEVREYEIEILKVQPNAADGRDLVLSVTDPALIAATGGIVQGMSGSPICQNGKIVGAVTHVLLNDPTRGYGIFIETMLDAAK